MAVTLMLSGILMLALFTMLWAAVALIQDKKLFGSAPKDIQAVIRERKERFPGARRMGWNLLVLAVLVFPACFAYGAWDGLHQGYGLWQFFARFLTMLWLLEVFDIVFFDWLLLTKTHFYQHYYPETEGCTGFRQFGFNKKGHIRDALLSPLIALALAWLCTLV